MQYLEVYLHYAAIERKREAEDPRPIPDASWTIMFKTLIGKKNSIVWGNEEPPVPASQVEGEVVNEKTGGDQVMRINEWAMSWQCWDVESK